MLPRGPEASISTSFLVIDRRLLQIFLLLAFRLLICPCCADYSLEEIEDEAYYLLGLVKAAELARIAVCRQTSRLNRVYHAKHLEAVLPSRVITLKKTQKCKARTHVVPSDKEANDHEHDGAGETPPRVNPTASEGVPESSSQTQGPSTAPALRRRQKRIKIRRSAAVLPAMREGDDASDEEAEEGEVRADVPSSTNAPRATSPVVMPKASLGYDTTGDAAGSPAGTAAPAPTMGFGVGAMSFEFPASPSSNEDRSPIHDERMASPVIQGAPAPSPVIQPSAPSPVSQPLVLTNASDQDAIHTEDEAGAARTHLSVSGEGTSDDAPPSSGGGKGFMGVLPRGVEPHHIGSFLKPEDFEDRPSASQGLEYTGRMLDLCQIENGLQEVDGKELVESLTRLTMKVCSCLTFYPYPSFLLSIDFCNLYLQGALLACYLAKGNPFTEVSDLKQRLRNSEDALRQEQEKYMKLRREHEKLLKVSSEFAIEQDRKINRLGQVLYDAEATIKTQEGALVMAYKSMKET